jgi:hypothetical protein
MLKVEAFHEIHYPVIFELEQYHSSRKFMV